MRGEFFFLIKLLECRVAMQVSVRGRVMRGRNQAAQPTHHRSSPPPVESEDFHVLTTHKATTTTTSFHHRHQASSSGPSAEGGSPPNYSNVSTLGEALHVQPTITWSPLPPRRATAAAAQSLCVTLYCDDNLDDITDIASRLPFRSSAEKNGRTNVLQSPITFDDVPENTPSVFSALDPYLPCEGPGNLRSRVQNVLDASTPEIGKSPPTRHSPFPHVGSTESPILRDTNLSSSHADHFPREDSHSPLHISHTPYSPMPSQPTMNPLHTIPFITDPLHSIKDSGKHRKKSHRSGGRRRKNAYGMSIASMSSSSSSTAVTDASLTAHLPPWHSIGNISLSYKLVQPMNSSHHSAGGPSNSGSSFSGDVRDQNGNPMAVIPNQTINMPPEHEISANQSTAAPSEKSLDLPLKGPAEPSACAISSSKSPLSPSDSILSTGFHLSPSSPSQKPFTHPGDTPTHSPATLRRRPAVDTSSHDLRLESIHDLSWLNEMEPEEQVLLEVHVIWSILSLMVVLLACYSLHHHHPLTG